MKISLGFTGRSVQVSELGGCRGGQDALVHTAENFVDATRYVKHRYLSNTPSYSLSLGSVPTTVNLLTGEIVLDIKTALDEQRLYTGLAPTPHLDARDELMAHEISESLKGAPESPGVKIAMRWWNELPASNREYLRRTQSTECVTDIVNYYNTARRQA